MTKLISISILLAAIFTLAASAPAIESSGERIVTTRHQIKVGQKMLRYTARAGLLPIRRNETGEIHGHMFFIAYLLDRLPTEPARPLTFLWNGGPGANSTLVHLSGFGPKRIKSCDDPAETPDCECELEDNQTTWFDQTDLVFVDPIGTGFSRPAKAEYAAEFYNTLGDIASVAEFVRVYLTRFDAWDAPLFISGESYGVWRAAGVAEALAQRGRKVAGVILISGGIPVGPIVSDEMRTALFIPTRAAAAQATTPLTSRTPAIPSGDCLSEYFRGIREDRVFALEEGTSNFTLIGREQTKEDPIGLRLTDNRQTVGALRFSFFLNGEIFKIESIVDATCGQVKEYSIEGRPGEKRTLQNWDTLQFTFGNRSSEN